MTPNLNQTYKPHSAEPSSPLTGPDFHDTALITSKINAAGDNVWRLLAWWSAHHAALNNHVLNLTFDHNGLPTIHVDRHTLTNLPPTAELVLGQTSILVNDFHCPEVWLTRAYGFETLRAWVPCDGFNVLITTPWTGAADVPRVPYLRCAQPEWFVRT